MVSDECGTAEPNLNKRSVFINDLLENKIIFQQLFT